MVPRKEPPYSFKTAINPRLPISLIHRLATDFIFGLSRGYKAVPYTVLKVYAQCGIVFPPSCISRPGSSPMNSMCRLSMDIDKDSDGARQFQGSVSRYRSVRCLGCSSIKNRLEAISCTTAPIHLRSARIGKNKIANSEVWPSPMLPSPSNPEAKRHSEHKTHHRPAVIHVTRRDRYRRGERQEYDDPESVYQRKDVDV